MFAAVRLRALADAVGEDDPSFREEVSFTAAQWRRRLRDHAQFAALLEERPVGLIGAQYENAEAVYLYSLWLDPAVRGRGLAHSLVTAAVDWAGECRVRTVKLRVAADNMAARGVYEDLGFTISHDEDHRRDGELMMSLSVR
ncbi:GNAT family N-acetyltransferase [Mycolicibacterium flavescens]|uniref:GNAT family N-acetyltransferase n=1 Tax=Mycolicibacterium flavescens TaxID=1776 RepID=A0A1E3RQG7_MYCFV|nr:GNAT family N-acetyltransferase [Mycolicibacterium flavescens]MCV7283185.1 GNAT family N-acetyltransferase [Mycolicibacterium flavescens]ODQ92098.1 GNAT family N-acetyltransferase [Mycolicibacterium flavescens]